MSDMVAEMKARAQDFLLNQIVTRPISVFFTDYHEEVSAELAAFAAKEVERADLQREGCHNHPCAIHYDKAGLMRCTQCELEATEAERLENAKVVCDECAHPESMKVKAAELSPSKKAWVHYFLDGNGHYICDAAPIWERAHGKKL